MKTSCVESRPRLEAFLDGELRGDHVRVMLQHLDECEICVGELRELREVGDVLRVSTAGEDRLPQAADGLASTVVSRVRAEANASWMSVVRRATEDWHWFAVGAGSVAATFACTVSLSALLAFGPKPEREDSLAGIITGLHAPVGYLFVVATPAGLGQESMLLQVENGERVSPRFATALALEAGGGTVTEAQLVAALSSSVLRKGHFVPLEKMKPEDRRQTEAWLDELAALRFNEPAVMGVGAVSVHEVRLVTSVNAKSL